jgi:hypothetical protein
MKSITLKHKDKTGKIIESEYIPVHERVKEFRRVFPDGVIQTEITHLTDEYCAVMAKIRIKVTDVEYDSTGIVATGHAIEFRKASNVNIYSYVENAETSAVGRALGFFGIGIETGIASEEEIKKSLHLEDKVNDGQLAMIEGLLHSATLSEKEVKQIEVNMFNFTSERAAKCIEYLKQNQRLTLDQEFKQITD